jgi:hypothetical protein
MSTNLIARPIINFDTIRVSRDKVLVTGARRVLRNHGQHFVKKNVNRTIPRLCLFFVQTYPRPNLINRQTPCTSNLITRRPPRFRDLPFAAVGYSVWCCCCWWIDEVCARCCTEEEEDGGLESHCRCVVVMGFLEMRCVIRGRVEWLESVRWKMVWTGLLFRYGGGLTIIFIK